GISRSSHADALRPQPPLHLALNRRQPLRRRRLVSRDENGLRVRGADQTPAIAEQDARAVDIDDVVLRAEMRHCFVDQSELALLRNFDPDLGRRYKVWNICEK